MILNETRLQYQAENCKKHCLGVCRRRGSSGTGKPISKCLFPLVGDYRRSNDRLRSSDPSLDTAEKQDPKALVKTSPLHPPSKNGEVSTKPWVEKVADKPRRIDPPHLQSVSLQHDGSTKLSLGLQRDLVIPTTATEVYD